MGAFLSKQFHIIIVLDFFVILLPQYHLSLCLHSAAKEPWMTGSWQLMRAMRCYRQQCLCRRCLNSHIISSFAFKWVLTSIKCSITNKHRGWCVWRLVPGKSLLNLIIPGVGKGWGGFSSRGSGRSSRGCWNCLQGGFHSPPNLGSGLALLLVGVPLCINLVRGDKKQSCSVALLRVIVPFYSVS